MKTILIDRKNFHRVINLEERVHAYDLMELNDVDWKRNANLTDALRLLKHTFYYEREFLDEYDQIVLIYKEK